MSKKKDQPFNNPFSKLALPSRAAKPLLAGLGRSPPPKKAKASQEDEDARLFLEAMGGATPLVKKVSRVGSAPARPAQDAPMPREDAESLARLAESVAGEGGFELIEGTVEGSVRGFDATVLKRLRAGEFPVQATLDLHGLTQEAAKQRVQGFVHDAKLAGHRCVVVVHGRGSHSEGEAPVLKGRVPGWLSQGRAARHVLAFTAATPQHGGAGAVYVLLRR